VQAVADRHVGSGGLEGLAQLDEGQRIAGAVGVKEA
jgi:hypothetical protein